MRRITAILAFFVIVTGVFGGNIEFTYNFSAPVVKNEGNYTLISFENTFLTGKTGEPALPYQAVRLLLPPGEEAVAVNYRYEDEEILDGNFLIYPAQPSQPVSKGADGIFHQDPAVYGSQENYPAKSSGEYSTQFLNGRSFLLASVTPVKYIPVEGKVSYFRKIVITVETRPTERAMQAMNNLKSNPQIEKIIAGITQNASMISSYPVNNTNRDEEYQILIITPQQFQNSFQALKDLYLVRGMKTELATTESIDQTVTGQDLQEKIRNYITGEYQDHNIQHVLLGGDVEHIPYRGFYCFVQSSIAYEENDIPADLYYSALDGNWNNDGDEHWAEIGEEDLLPDVSVARMPFSNISQLQRILHKTIMYQDDPVEGELRNTLMAGENLYPNPLTYGEDYLELLIGYHEDNGYTTDGIPEDYNFNKLYDSEMSWDKFTLIGAINQGTNFIHHSGHANETYVMRLNIDDINNTNFSLVDGILHNYPIIYTHGCLCGAFDMNDCIGEAMVLIDNFAVAGAFNSEFGWFNEGQTEGPSAHLHREFTDALYHDKECRIGAAHMISKIETSVWVNAPGQWEEGALRWCFYDCNIFGDPALGTWTDEPISIETNYPDEIYPNTTEVPVIVTSNGLPVPDMMCVIMGDGAMLGCAVTGFNGLAEISIPEGFASVDSAELIISGYNCLPNHYGLLINPVGISEGEMTAREIIVVPNPFSDQVRLSFILGEDMPVNLNFTVMSGQTFAKMAIDGKKGMNVLNLSTAEWPEGLIEVRISSGSQAIQARLMHIKK